MKTIQLQKLVLENFKKFKSLTITFDGNTIIKGDNETGKTTIVDAVNWLLFEKNSQGANSFSIKPIVNGEEQHNLVVSVYAEFLVDGCLKTLKRSTIEDWVKKRGSTAPVYAGNHSEFEVDGVPGKKASDFKTEVNNLVDETTFGLITNVNKFNTLDKKQKRDILLKSVPEINDIDIIRENEELKQLEVSLNKGDGTYRSVSDALAIAKAAKVKLDKELVTYGPMINEYNKSITSASNEEDYGTINECEEKIKLIDNKTALINSQKDGDANQVLVQQIQKQIMDKKSELLDAKANNQAPMLKQKAINEQNQVIFGLQSELQSANNDARMNDNDCQLTIKAIDSLNLDIERKQKEIELLYKQCADIDSRLFNPSDAICPTCGRELQPEKIQEIQSKFNLNKSQDLEKAIECGKKAKKAIENISSELSIAQSNLKAFNEKKETIGKKLVAIGKKLVDEKKILEGIQSKEVCESEQEVQIKNELEQLESDLSAVKVAENSSDKLKLELLELKEERDKWYEKLERAKQNIANRERVHELEAEQDHKATERNNAESTMVLCERFTVVKCGLIEENINDLFSVVKFKLFNTAINGGITECCTATVNGVPYEDVNSAGKINAGLDIIKTLQRENNVQAFIFIDNAESITNVTPMNCQLIKLYVDANQPQIVVLKEE